MRLARNIVLLTCGLLSPVCIADIALLQNGNVLANVHVDDRHGTETQPLRVRYFPNSFEYKPESNSVHLLSGNSRLYPVADVISTTSAFDKGMVRNLYKEQEWRYYSPPPRAIVVHPERDAPPAEAAVMPTTATVAIVPNVIPATVPLDIRVTKQLDMFLTEQKMLVNTLATSVTIGQISTDQSLEYRLYLLNSQKDVLRRYFPPQAEVLNALQTWDELTSQVSRNRRFPFEI